MGTPDASIPVDHIIVYMGENRSFDHFLGRLNQPEFYGSEIDGLLPEMNNLDPQGNPVPVYHESDYCPGSPGHSWNASHRAVNEGKMDGFVTASAGKDGNDGKQAMGYYDQSDLPLLYALANQFTVGDRYFSSLPGPTFPNRFYLMTGSSFGHIKNDKKRHRTERTIFHALNDAGVSWGIYKTDIAPILLWKKFSRANRKKIHHISKFRRDLRRGRLPKVVFLEGSFLLGDEHPSGFFQLSQKMMSRNIFSWMKSSYWKNSLLLMTYDEHGGFYDHVAPPEACIPDDHEPKLVDSSIPGRFDRYGVRVPFIAVSPWVKRHHVTHGVYDHASILRLIERKFNIPALTRRDANANDLTDLFVEGEPDFSRPHLPRVKIDKSELWRCLLKKFKRGDES